MSHASDVLIAGAGIVGSACALACVRRGLRVAIVESSGIGAGATAAGMGHIVAMDDSPAQLALTNYSQQLWRDLSATLPPSVEYDPCGTLWVASDDEEMREVERKSKVYGAAGLLTEILDSRALANAEPNLRRPLAGALLVPSDAVLYPPCAAAFLMAQAQQLGAQLFSPRKVISAAAGKAQLDDGSEIHAAHIVIATGADAVALIAQLPIRKRKGHLAITDRYPGYVRHQLVELGYLKSAHATTADSVAFNVQPRRTGQILIGSSRQFNAETPEVDHPNLAAMIHRAQSYLPDIGSLSTIRIWTGFRAATPDKLPLIGPWLSDPSLILATGHEGLGITTSLATAQLVADHICSRASAIPIDPYLPARFAKVAAHV